MGPEQLIQGLEGGSKIARWQRAADLAFMLPGSRYDEFRRQGAPAAHLGRILMKEIDEGGMKDEDVAMREYLVRALGLFEVNEGVDALLKAAETNRGPAERNVRYQAIEHIARRAHNLSLHAPPEKLGHPDLEPTLLRLAADEDPAIRERTVFALGKIGTPAAIEKLRVLVDDPNAETRYNAAIALAHRGDERSATTLVEMLDVAEMAKQSEKVGDETNAAFKHHLIIASAIDAAHALARKNAEADLSALIQSLENLANVDSQTLKAAGVPPKIASDAKHALSMIKGKR
jgi:HEAT repeat protein